MPRPTTFEPDEILACLARHEVELILVGGLAGVAHGAGWPTYDVDVVVRVDEANLERLLGALAEIRAEYDTFHQPPLVPDPQRLRRGTGPQLFRTTHGRLDVLKEAGGETYETLSIDAMEVEQPGHSVRCASLSALLRMKRAANRPKDRAAIPKLEEALIRASSQPATTLSAEARAIHHVTIVLRSRAGQGTADLDEVVAVTDAVEQAIVELDLGRDFSLSWMTLDGSAPRCEAPHA